MEYIQGLGFRVPGFRVCVLGFQSTRVNPKPKQRTSAKEHHDCAARVRVCLLSHAPRRGLELCGASGSSET